MWEMVITIRAGKQLVGEYMGEKIRTVVADKRVRPSTDQLISCNLVPAFKCYSCRCLCCPLPFPVVDLQLSEHKCVQEIECKNSSKELYFFLCAHERCGELFPISGSI